MMVETHGRVMTVIFQTSCGLWWLQGFGEISRQVFMLLSFNRYIDALDMAQTLQLRVDNVNEFNLPIMAEKQGA